MALLSPAAAAATEAGKAKLRAAARQLWVRTDDGRLIKRSGGVGEGGEGMPMGEEGLQGQQGSATDGEAYMEAVLRASGAA